MRRTYSTLVMSRRHPQLFLKLTARARLEYWPTSKDGTHLVLVGRPGIVQQVGVLWTPL